MSPYLVFYIGLHCLPKYLFTSVQNQGRAVETSFLTDYNCPGKYSRSGQYWSIEKLSGRLSF